MTPVSAESCPLSAALRVLKFPSDPHITFPSAARECAAPCLLSSKPSGVLVRAMEKPPSIAAK